MDYRVSIELATLILAIVGVISITAIGSILMTMVHRQRMDIRDGRRLVKMMAQLAVLLEADNRKNRHAIKNIAVTLQMQKIADELQETIEVDEVVQEAPGTIVNKLVALSNDDGPEEVYATP